MSDSIQAAIEVLLNKIRISTTPDEALKFTQAALNLANTAMTLSNISGRKN